ncbi:MAG: DUF1622 domain-containing protein [Anaerolineae bacterium]
MEDIEFLTTVMTYIIVIVEACGALVVFLGVLRTVYRYLRVFLRRQTVNIATLRLQLGQSMVMGLEFQVAADILKTALSPSWNEVLLLAALIALRTLLNYLLEREVEHIGLDKFYFKLD